MVRIHTAFGLRFAILTNDHVPAHVHIFGDGEAKIEIAGPDGLPRMVWSVGLSRTDQRRAMDVVRERQREFMARWEQIHGATD